MRAKWWVTPKKMRGRFMRLYMQRRQNLMGTWILESEEWKIVSLLSIWVSGKMEELSTVTKEKAWGIGLEERQEFPFFLISYTGGMWQRKVFTEEDRYWIWRIKLQNCSIGIRYDIEAVVSSPRRTVHSDICEFTSASRRCSVYKPAPWHQASKLQLPHQQGWQHLRKGLS